MGGTVAYAPQTPWIRNATLQDNIVFGQHGAAVTQERSVVFGFLI